MLSRLIIIAVNTCSTVVSRAPVILTSLNIHEHLCMIQLGRQFLTLPSPFTVLLSSSLSIEALGNLRHFWRPTCFSLLSIALSRLWRSLKPYLVKNSGNGTRERKFFSFADRSLLNVFDKKISFLQTHMQTGCFFRHTTYCVCVATSYRVTRQVDY